MDDSRGKDKHDMIIGCDIFSKLQIYLFFSKNNKGFIYPMKDATTVMLSAKFHDIIFCHEDLWESKYILGNTRRIWRVLDAHYEKYDLRKV